MRRIARHALALLLLCLFLAPARARDNYPRATDLDAVHYRIRLEIKDGSDEIAADTEILFAAAADTPRAVALDFGRLTVDAVTEEGRPAQFTRAGEKLNVALKGNYRRGERFRIGVSYHGRPADGLVIKRNKFGDFIVFADNWPNRAHHWFPSIDHPYDKATAEFFVTAPARFDVVANGTLVETTSRQDGTRLTHWSERVPIPVYCMVVGVADFSILHRGEWEDVPLSYYLFPKDRDKGVAAFGRAGEMIEFYTRLVGPFPYEKLALVQSSTRFGGMENSSSIFFSENSISREGGVEGTVAHEIAHQWFGDSVTEADWHHLWLSEGFASYFGALFFEHFEGRDKFLSVMRAAHARYLERSAPDFRPIHDPSITDLFKLLNGNNYQKGSWVLHMLRRRVGDRAFFDGVRDYYRTYRDRTALTEDFQRVMEFHSGQRLDWFFRQWIYQGGHPVYDAWWRWDEPSKQLTLRVRQTQPSPLFRVPLDVEIQTGATAKRELVEVDEREETFTFKLDARPSAVRVDPDEWVLKVLTLREQ